MTNLVGPKGIQAIATGSLFPEAPPIFPDATAIQEGSVIRLTNLVGLSTLNFVPEPDSRFTFTNSITCTGALTAALTAPYCIYGAISSLFLTAVYKSLQWYCRRPSDKTIYLQPEPTQKFASITYDQKLDAIVQNACVDSKMVDQLDLCFREYRLKVFGKARLEQKIKDIVEQSTLSKKAVKIKKPLLDEAEDLFANRPDYSHAKRKKLVTVAGPTGAGKSTLINYLFGNNMKGINPIFLRQERDSDQERVIIAENSITEIGHKFGSGSSQTLYPQIIRDQEEDFLYCDAPGFKDNRKIAIEICGARSTQEIMLSCELIGVLYLIEYPDLEAVRADNFLKNLKLLQLLLKTFHGYSNKLLFMVAKTPSGAKLPVIRKQIIHLLKTVKTKDPNFHSFCNRILESKALDRNLFLFNPCDGGSLRSAVIKKIKAHNDYWTWKFGYPLSQDALRELEAIRQKAQTNIEKTLLSLKGRLHTLLSSKIALCMTPLDAKKCYLEINTCRFDMEEILKFCQTLFPDLVDPLKADQEAWGKSNTLLDDDHWLDKILAPYFQQINDDLLRLKKDVENHYQSMTLDPTPIWKTKENRSGVCAIF